MNSRTDSNTGLFGLIGHPVALSKSPDIHSISFEKNGINGSYLVFDVDGDSLMDAVKGLKAIGVTGFNVTIPYKEEIIKHLDEVRGEAIFMNSVNTVKNENGKLIGYNTDGAGFLYSLEASEVELSHKTILLLGAGGACKGIAHAIASGGKPKKVIILNRTISKAEELCSELKKAYENNIEYCHADFQWLKSSNVELFGEIDIVVNTTSIGMYPNEDQLACDPNLFNVDTVFADIVYKPHDTLFLKRASEMGAKVVHGIDMLIYQGLLAEQIWIEKEIELASTREEVIKALKIGD